MMKFLWNIVKLFLAMVVGQYLAINIVKLPIIIIIGIVILFIIGALINTNRFSFLEDTTIKNLYNLVKDTIKKGKANIGGFNKFVLFLTMFSFFKHSTLSNVTAILISISFITLLLWFVVKEGYQIKNNKIRFLHESLKTSIAGRE